jgi:molybdopterin-containing oxidoreductase family molybdopterin binding subunit
MPDPTTAQTGIEDVWIPTVCNMCYNNCTIQVHRVDGVLTKVTGIPDAPPNHGRVCAKSNAQVLTVYSPHRVKKPMLRTNPRKGLDEDPGWREISWDEALDILAERLKQVREDDPRKLIILSFDGQSYLPIRAFASGFGTNNYTTGSAGYFCGNAIHPVAYAITGCIDIQMDLRYTDYCLQFGCQYGFVAMSHAIHAASELAEQREQRGMKLVVVDPVLSNAAGKSDEWVPIRPGTDAALALGMIHVLTNELGVYDRDYLKRYTNAPYLVGPDGGYVREPLSPLPPAESPLPLGEGQGEGVPGSEGAPGGRTAAVGGPVPGRPLVWNRQADRAEPFDECPWEAVALGGVYQVNGVACRPAFTVFREHVSKYTPETVEQITTVPAATVRRLAEDFGRAARIGSTIVIDGQELPHRPAVAFWYRGVSQHKHSLHNGFAIALLNVIVGAVDVPGGLLNANAAGPFGFPVEGPDGLITRGNPYSHMRPAWPPQEVKKPESLELLELFPLSVYARTAPWLGILEPEKYKVPYHPEVLIHCRTNIVSTSADSERTALALSKVPFQVSFVDFMNETACLADMVLPDTHCLERLLPFAADPFTTFYATPLPEDDWWFAAQQPTIQPQGEARYWIEVLYELADRVGCRPDVYAAFNVLGPFSDPFLLDPNEKYTWEEICDRWIHSRCGPEVGLEYFKQHGYYKLGKRKVQESYPRAFHKARIPMYFEHFKKAGWRVKEVVDELGYTFWELDDYQALIDFKPCPSFSQNGGSLYLVNTKVPFYAHTVSAENAVLNDLAERNTHMFAVTINPRTAKKLGIAHGDPIVLETDWGKRVEGIAELREGIHPEVLASPGITGRLVTGDPRIRRKGIHYNSLIKFSDDMMDYTSAALDACVRVKVNRK